MAPKLLLDEHISSEVAHRLVVLGFELTAGDLLAIAPQVLAEFIHIVTDPRRFAQPLEMTAVRRLAEGGSVSRASAAASETGAREG
jgi:hypothetical protein